MQLFGLACIGILKGKLFGEGVGLQGHTLLKGASYGTTLINVGIIGLSVGVSQLLTMLVLLEFCMEAARVLCA